ncbi:MAG: hypothetical protein ACI8PZ_001169 [Myxococcota bacterium]|jgi:hypothetical protein
MLQTLTDGVHVQVATQRFYGLEVGARMTVLQLEGGVLVVSPLDVPPDSVAHLGPLRWVLAPNLLHHLYVGPWIDAGAEGWAAPGLPAKRPDLTFHGVVEPGVQPFGPEVELIPLRCFPFASEVVLLHRPSRTLVVTDLVFNFDPTAPWLTRAAMRCACGYPGCRTTLLERALMHRDIAREEVQGLLALDFDRLVLAHGEVIETGGRAALAGAFDWLGLTGAQT